MLDSDKDMMSVSGRKNAEQYMYIRKYMYINIQYISVSCNRYNINIKSVI